MTPITDRPILNANFLPARSSINTPASSSRAAAITLDSPMSIFQAVFSGNSGHTSKMPLSIATLIATHSPFSGRAEHSALTISVIQTRLKSAGRQGNRFNLAKAIKGPVSTTIVLAEIFKFLLQFTGQWTGDGYAQCSQYIHEFHHAHASEPSRFAEGNSFLIKKFYG